MNVDDQRHEAMESPPAAETAAAEAGAGSSIGDQVMGILHDVERQFDRLRAAQASQAQEVESLTDRAADLDRREHELATRQAALEQRQHEQAELHESLERQRDEQQCAAETLARDEAELSEMRAELAHERRELDSRRSELQAAQEILSSEQQAFEESRERWKVRRRELDAEFAARVADVDQREEEIGREHERKLSAATERLSWLEGELERAETEHRQSRDQVAAEQQRAAEAEGRNAELVTDLDAGARELEVAAERARELQQQLDAQERTLAESREQLERAEAGASEAAREAEREREAIRRQLDETLKHQEELAEQLGEARRALAGAREQEDATADRLAAVEQESSSARDELVALRNEHAEQQKRLEQITTERQALADELEARRAALETLDGEHRAVASALDQRDEELAACTAEIAERQRAVEELEARLADSQEKLELAGRKLAQFSEVLAQQSEQLEQAAATAMVAEQQKQQIESLSEQLAEAKLCGDAEVVQRKDQRIKELTEALRQARGQTGTVIDVDELEQRNSELAEQNDQLRLALERAQVDAHGAKSQLDDAVASAAARDQTQHRSFQEDRVRLESRVAELEQELEARRSELEEESAERAALAQRLDEYRDRIGDLEDELDTAHGEASLGDAGPAPGVDLTAKEKKLLEGAEHLRRRQARLRRVRRLLRRARTASAVADMKEEERAAELRKLRQERLQLDEVRRMLAQSERQMVRKWALPRAIGVVCWLFMLLGLNAGAAWLAADLVYPVEATAMVVIEAATSSGEPVSSGALEQWRTDTTGLVADERFHVGVAKRMADRRMDMYAEPAAVAERLQGLGVDTAEPDEITLSLSGTNSEEIMAVLDVVASSLATQSQQTASRRGEPVFGSVRGERVEDGRVRYASLSPVPLRDVRLDRALPIFGGGVVVSLTLILLFFRRLLRAKRLFEEHDGDALAPEPAV